MPYICPAPSGATLTFEFRLWPGLEQPGVIDSGHKGPCAVYVKKVDDMFADAAAGPGWFKIWEDGYDVEGDRWCVDTLRARDGLLSVDLPAGLPSGYYLVRTEVLALHAAYRGDPQIFIGCAQIFVQSGPEGELDIPGEYEASIPGYVDGDTPGLEFDIYQSPVPEYPMPGPPLYAPPASSSSTSSTSSDGKTAATQRDGAVPADCVLKNANWCAEPLETYSGEAACWEATDACYAQSKTCWASAPPTGSANCYTWSAYCAALDEACAGGDFEGPPAFDGKEEYADVPGAIPEPWGTSAEAATGGGDNVVVSAAVVDGGEESQTGGCSGKKRKRVKRRQTGQMGW